MCTTRSRWLQALSGLGLVGLLGSGPTVLATADGAVEGRRARLGTARSQDTPADCTTPTGERIEPPFCGAYSIRDVGRVPGLPTPYGGLVFAPGDPDRILIGGAANEAHGKIYSVRVARDSQRRIVGFAETAVPSIDAPFNDGGVAFGPGDVLFLARYPQTELGQSKPGSGLTDKVVNLRSFGVAGSPGGLAFVPEGDGVL